MDMMRDFFKNYFKGKYAPQTIDKMVNDIIVSGDPDVCSFMDLGSKEFVFFNVNEIERVEYNKNLEGFVFHKESSSYLFCNNAIDPLSILNDNFIEVKKNIHVNVNKITFYNSYMCIIYFDNPQNSTNHISIPQIAMQKKVIVKIADKSKDIFTETDFEYFPLKTRKQHLT